MLNQCWLIVNWTLRNKLKWSWDQSIKLFCQENVIGNVVCRMAAILLMTSHLLGPESSWALVQDRSMFHICISLSQEAYGFSSLKVKFCIYIYIFLWPNTDLRQGYPSRPLIYNFFRPQDFLVLCSAKVHLYLPNSFHFPAFKIIPLPKKISNEVMLLFFFPAFWRLVLCLSIVYELAMIFLLFQVSLVDLCIFNF